MRSEQFVPIGPECATYCLDDLSVLEKCRLVLDFARGDPRLDLVSQPLQLLYLRLEIELKFLLLCLVR